MTQEENNSEVFLGPTGSETEEFYSYQRKNPGLDKSMYLDWFQKRFNKEIELRRRRSDQPSDLEFMVIKKRSKYRERIGEESAELVAYSEAHPDKTYRELADWFQKRFQKEIDITAISRRLQRGGDLPGEALMFTGALKRSRQDEVQTPGFPEQTTPPAKRGRRALHTSSVPASMNGHHSAQGPPVSTTPTFTVEMNTRQHPGSASHTPSNLSPNQTPKHRNATLPPLDEATRILPRQPPGSQLPNPSHQPSGPPAHFPSTHLQNRATNSPEQLPRTPVWTTVNPTQPRETVAGRSPPRPAPAVTRSPVLPNPAPSQSASRHHRPSSMSGPPPHPTHPPLAPAPPGHVRPPTLPPPYPSSRREVVLSLQQRLQAAMDKSYRGAEELRQVESEMFALLNEKITNDRQLEEERARFRQERDQLQDSLEVYKTWVDELKRGNLELQEDQARHEKLRECLKNENDYLRHHEMPKLTTRLDERERQLAYARKLLRENGVSDEGSPTPSVAEPKPGPEIDRWVRDRLTADGRNEQQLQEMVDRVEAAGLKDLQGQFQALKAFLDGMSREREVKEHEWDRMVNQVIEVRSLVAASAQELPPPLSRDIVMDDAGDNADDEAEEGAAAAAAARDSKQTSKEPSPRPSPSRIGSPSTASTSPLTNGPENDEDKEMVTPPSPQTETTMV